jgi:hypothetical protein
MELFTRVDLGTTTFHLARCSGASLHISSYGVLSFRLNKARYAWICG